MNEGVMSEGGFLVAPEYSQELINDAMETGLLAGRCRSIRMSRNSLTLPGVDESSRADGSRMGGVRAYWENEAASITDSKPKWRAINMKAKKLTGLVYMTDELLEDAPACEDWTKTGFADEFGFKIDGALIRGSGAGEPLGILNAGCKVRQNKETGQAADMLVAENFMHMFSRMMPRSLRSAIWMINQECWPQIFKLHLKVGTGGVPMFIEPGKIADAPYGAILGRPILPIEQAAALGDEGDVIFADWSAYILARKNGMQTASSMHVKFVTAEEAFRFIIRMDGEPMRTKPLTPFKGSASATLSSFVTLQARE
jgi:HK97 family phage major capsid protein